MHKWKFTFIAGLSVVVGAASVLIIQRGPDLVSETAGAATPNPAMMAMPVPVTEIVKKTIPIYLEYSARTDAIRHVALQAKVAGYVEQQHVADGSDDKKDDLLYTNDPRGFQTGPRSAKGQLQPGSAAPDYSRRHPSPR